MADLLSSLPIIRLKRKEGRRVKSGAPWVFSNEIVMDAAAKGLAPGTLVGLADDVGTKLGTGYFNPKSLIAIRLLAKPDTEIDTDFFYKKLRQALHLRNQFYDTPFYRLVHAEGDGLPGVVIDRFGDTAVVQIATAGMERLRDDLLNAVEAAIAPKNVLLRNDVPARALEGLDSYVRAASGDIPRRVEIQENGIRYFADLTGGQKSGWYYDQRANGRSWPIAPKIRVCSTLIATAAVSACWLRRAAPAKLSAWILPKQLDAGDGSSTGERLG
jgi:23S rRNA (cytosine1962-C5)-methyltransferase